VLSLYKQIKTVMKKKNYIIVTAMNIWVSTKVPPRISWCVIF